MKRSVVSVMIALYVCMQPVLAYDVPMGLSADSKLCNKCHRLYDNCIIDAVLSEHTTAAAAQEGIDRCRSFRSKCSAQFSCRNNS
jgi:hypothetical protein